MARSLTALVVLAAVACGGSAGDGSPSGGSPTPAPSAPVSSSAYFPPEAVWYRDVSAAALDPQSSAVIANLDRAGWGLGRMQIDFSIEVLAADAGTPLRPFTPTEDFFEPDCDLAPVPVPAGGALEGEQGYECPGDGDCHLIVADRSRMKLYEMWRADIRGDSFRGGCLAVWDMTRVYPASGRGEQCTSADAAGYPIAPLLFDADEVAAGRIDHAIRFILPNAHDPRARVRAPGDARHARHERPSRRPALRRAAAAARRLPARGSPERGRPRRGARDAALRHAAGRRR